MNWKSLECYWNVGRLIVEAQGGKKKAKYVNELLKIWGETNEYGKGYDYGNLARFRKLYLCFPILGPVGPILTWIINNFKSLIKNKKSLLITSYLLLFNIDLG